MTARCYSCICHIKSCQSALTRITAAMIVSSLTVTRLDYGNSFLAGCTKQTLDNMHRLLNCSASYIRWRQSPSCDSTTPRSSALAAFKLCLLAYKAIHGLAPCYLNERCIPVFTVPNLSGLRSGAHGVVRRTRLQLGNRAFCVAGPVACNSLPLDIHSTPTLSTFKTSFLTFLL